MRLEETIAAQRDTCGRHAHTNEDMRTIQKIFLSKRHAILQELFPVNRNSNDAIKTAILHMK